MSKLATIALVAALAGPSAVFASPAQVSGAVAVSGRVSQQCELGNPTLLAGTLVNFESLNGTSLPISQLADPKTLATEAASATVTFPAMCNFPHQIVLRSQNNGLYRGGSNGAPPPSGFADGIPYTAQLTWGRVTSTFFVPATTRQSSQDVITVPQATAGNLQVQLTIQPGASNLAAQSPLIAGIYSDTLFITMEPQ